MPEILFSINSTFNTFVTMMACATVPKLIPLPERGQIQIIFGPMFSGKTTELIRRVKRFQFANHKCLMVKYAKDVRYDKDDVATHDRQTFTAVGATTLLPLLSDALEYDVIGIDEGQFFPDVVQFSETAAGAGKIVIVAALDGTFQRKGFGDILHLVPLAEHVMKLTAVCMSCFGDASFTKRIGQEQEVEVIGGADKYLAVCRMCFKSPVKVPSSPLRKADKEPCHKLSDRQAAGRRLFGTELEQNCMDVAN